MITTFVRRMLAFRECNLCHSRVYKFNPIGISYITNLQKKGFSIPVDKFETLNFKEYNCPFCNAKDRDRFICLYLKKNMLSKETLNLLDIAPAPSVETFLKQQHNIKYRSADLYMENVDDKVDIQNMEIYENDKFDVIICSHVLEHIPDDMKALREMHRILKPTGTCVLLVPIPLYDVSYDEDLGMLPKEDRERRFGQDDHLRLYTGKVFEERIVAGGFRLEKVYANKEFTPTELRKYGIASGSVLYIGKK